MTRIEPMTRQRLEATKKTVDVIADECGFGSAERMRRTFQRQLGVAPAQYRERFHTPDSHSPLEEERVS